MIFEEEPKSMGGFDFSLSSKKILYIYILGLVNEICAIVDCY